MAIPGNANLLLLTEAAGAAPTGYTIDRSIRLNSPDSAYLSRTPSSAGNQTTWTWSGWVKRSSFDTTNNFFVAGTSAFANIRFANQNIDFTAYNGSSYIGRKVTSAVYRDPSAWYHIVCVFDTSNATAADRMRVYVNGVREESFSTSTDPTQNATSVINSNVEHRVGTFDGSTEFFNGYLADVHFIDGQALDPTSFGEFDATTGVWNPIEYAGDYNITSGIEYSTFINPANAFDNDGSTYATVNGNGNLGEFTNLSVSVTSSLSVKILSGTSGNVYVNGVATAFSGSGSTQTISISSPPAVVTSLGFQSSSQPDVYEVIADGSRVVGTLATGVNSFHLDFADNSSAAALGYDAAGSNDWTVNNISIGVPTYTGNVTATASPSGSSMIIKAVGATVTGTFNAASGTGGSINYYTSSNGIDWSFQETSSGQSSSFTAKYISMGGGSNDVRQFTSTSGSYKYSISGSTSLDNNAATVTVDQTGLFNESGNDSLRDSPTNGDTADDTGAGGEVPGNYCVWNPLASQSGITLSDGNLLASAGAVNSGNARSNGTISVSSGKWYYEVTLITAGTNDIYGIGQEQLITTYVGADAKSYGYAPEEGVKKNNGTDTSYGSTGTTGDVFMCAFDLDNLKVFFGKNGTWFDSSNPANGTSPAFTLTSGVYAPVIRPYSSSGTAQLAVNFGQRAFAYSAPSGYKALCTANLDDPTIADGSTAMDVALYTGNGSTQTISGLNLSPDLVWVKNRSTNLNNHTLVDTVRGPSVRLRSEQTGEEYFEVGFNVTAFNSDGFTVVDNTGGAYNVNGSVGGVYSGAAQYVGWTWDGGSSTVSNTDGTITSSVRANASAGFSVVTYTGNGTSGATVGHGLGVKPGMVIIKSRSIADNWLVAHEGAGTTGDTLGGFAESYTLYLESTAGRANFTNAAAALGNSSVFAVADGSEVNQNVATYVAYCFAPVEGYSAFGSYVGNGSSTDGPFVFTGMRPRWILLKSSSISGAWILYDTARDTYNYARNRLFPSSSSAESLGANYIDILCNGFKHRDSDPWTNQNGDTYIYAAFAENPFKYARAR